MPVRAPCPLAVALLLSLTGYSLLCCCPADAAEHGVRDTPRLADDIPAEVQRLRQENQELLQELQALKGRACPDHCAAPLATPPGARVYDGCEVPAGASRISVGDSTASRAPKRVPGDSDRDLDLARARTSASHGKAGMSSARTWPSDRASYVKAITEASLGQGSVRCAQLLRLRSRALAGLTAEAAHLYADGHHYRTRVYGYKTAGGSLHDWPDEDQTDMNMGSNDKQFLLDAARFPWFSTLVRDLPASTTFVHLLSLDGNEQDSLALHQERVVFRRPEAPAGQYFVGARFHIPLDQHSPTGSSGAAESWMLMDNNVYTARRGDLFFYCNGCTHVSYTKPGVRRMNIVIDIMLTEEAVEYLFPQGAPAAAARQPRDTPEGKPKASLPSEGNKASDFGDEATARHDSQGLPADSMFMRVATEEAPCTWLGISTPPPVKASESQ